MAKYLFTKEQIDKLKPLENYLITSYKYNFKRGTVQKENDLLNEVWFELTGEKLNNFNCGSCALKNYQQVAKVYFESIENLNKITETKTEDVCQETAVVKKAARKKQSSTKN